MDVTSVCNIALAESMTRTQISGFPPIDNSPAANAAKLFYTPKIQSIIRAANWNFTRRQALLSLLRAVIINGTTSSDPPPQPWQYQYLYPSDCLKARFIMQFQTPNIAGIPLTTAPSNVTTPAYAVTNIPFVEAIDMSATQSPRKTILTNMQDAQLVYTVDISQYPDMWDKLFLSAATAVLGAYFAATLSGDDKAVQMMTAAAKGALDAARASNGNESISNVDHQPDWISARMRTGLSSWWSSSGGSNIWGWDACELPGGLFY